MTSISVGDPLLHKVSVEATLVFLREAGWKETQHPNDKVVVLEGPKDDDGDPLQLVLPRDDDVRDADVLLVEAIGLLAVLEGLAPHEVIDKIINKNGRISGNSLVNRVGRITHRLFLRFLSARTLLYIVVGILLSAFFALVVVDVYGRRRQEAQATLELTKIKVQKLGEIWERIDGIDLKLDRLVEDHLDSSKDSEPAEKRANEATQLLFEQQMIVSENRFWLGEHLYGQLVKYVDINMNYVINGFLSTEPEQRQLNRRRRDEARDALGVSRSASLEGLTNDALHIPAERQ